MAKLGTALRVFVPVAQPNGVPYTGVAADITALIIAPDGIATLAPAVSEVGTTGVYTAIITAAFSTANGTGMYSVNFTIAATGPNVTDFGGGMIEFTATDTDDITATFVANSVWDALRSAHNVALSFGESVRLDSVGLQSAAITASKFAAGAIDAAAIATDAIGAAELSLAAANKIRDTILSDATAFPGASITEARLAELDPANLPGDLATILARLTGIEGAGFLTGTDSLEAIRNRGDIAWITGPGASAIAGAVWDELRAGHTTPLSFGESVRLDSTGLQAAAITAAKFAAAAITATVIADGAITEPKIAAAAITAAKFAANAITSTVIADGTITEPKIAAAAITAAKFAANAITATVMATDSIGADQLATSAVNEIVDQTWREILLDHSGVAGSTAAALAGADAVQFRVEQAYTRSISSPAGSRVRGLFALHRDGQFIALPGTARLAIEIRESDGTLIDSDSDIVPNSEGYFAVEFDPWTLVPGTVDISIATVTLSGVGPGTHVSAIVIAWPDFVPTI